MKPILVAFTWTMILAILAGLVFSLAFWWVEWPWYVWPALTSGVSIVMAWIDARNLLSRRLGNRPQATLIQSNRLIPVAFEAILPGRAKDVKMPDEMYIRLPGGDRIEEPMIRAFVWKTYARQTAGRPAVSRHYWTKVHKPRLTREEYDSLVEALMAAGAIVGRRAGASGRLAKPYDETIKLLRGE